MSGSDETSPSVFDLELAGDDHTSPPAASPSLLHAHAIHTHTEAKNPRESHSRSLDVQHAIEETQVISYAPPLSEAIANDHDASIRSCHVGCDGPRAEVILAPAQHPWLLPIGAPGPTLCSLISHGDSARRDAASALAPI